MSLRDIVVQRVPGREQVYEAVRAQYEEEGTSYWEDEQGMHLMLSDTDFPSGNELRTLADRIDEAGGKTSTFRQKHGL